MTDDTYPAGGGVAVVTGGARNLGRAIVLALAGVGFDLVVNTRSDLEQAEAVAEEARDLGVRALPVLADVTDGAAVAGMMRAAADLGPLRVLVNNAALRTRVPVDEMTFDDWRAVHSVILDGAFHCVRAALPALRAAASDDGGGRIITLLGANALRGDPARVHVAAAKYGLVGMTLALAGACAGAGITVNAVSPGQVTRGDEQEIVQHRAGVASTVTFLASAAASEVTGQVIEVGPKP
jgi:3-oxoacyl-[acyl-carrier protein] reductase